MRIRIYGGTQLQRETARSCARFVLSEEMPISATKQNNSTIYIRFTNEPNADYYGCAYTPADNSYVARTYTVKVNLAEAKTEEELLETLMHELVHVAQMANRRLMRYTYDKFDEKYYVFWKGSKHDPEKNYSKQPWERQAFYWEKKLVDKFLNR